jgi:hypothetical protein
MALFIRSPRNTSKLALFGYHDDSFTFSTLDGPANGNIYKKFFFWNRILAANEKDFWKHGVMGKFHFKVFIEKI